MPNPTNTINVAAQEAMAIGCAAQTRQLAVTDCHTPARVPISMGIAMTLEANMGAAKTPPINSQSSNK